MEKLPVVFVSPFQTLAWKKSFATSLLVLGALGSVMIGCGRNSHITLKGEATPTPAADPFEIQRQTQAKIEAAKIPLDGTLTFLSEEDAKGKALDIVPGQVSKPSDDTTMGRPTLKQVDQSNKLRRAHKFKRTFFRSIFQMPELEKISKVTDSKRTDGSVPVLDLTDVAVILRKGSDVSDLSALVSTSSSLKLCVYGKKKAETLCKNLSEVVFMDGFSLTALDPLKISITPIMVGDVTYDVAIFPSMKIDFLKTFGLGDLAKQKEFFRIYAHDFAKPNFKKVIFSVGDAAYVKGGKLDIGFILNPGESLKKEDPAALVGTDDDLKPFNPNAKKDSDNGTGGGNGGGDLPNTIPVKVTDGNGNVHVAPGKIEKDPLTGEHTCNVTIPLKCEENKVVTIAPLEKFKIVAKGWHDKSIITSIHSATKVSEVSKITIRRIEAAEIKSLRSSKDPKDKTKLDLYSAPFEQVFSSSLPVSLQLPQSSKTFELHEGVQIPVYTIDLLNDENCKEDCKPDAVDNVSIDGNGVDNQQKMPGVLPELAKTGFYIEDTVGAGSIKGTNIDQGLLEIAILEGAVKFESGKSELAGQGHKDIAGETEMKKKLEQFIKESGTAIKSITVRGFASREWGKIPSNIRDLKSLSGLNYSSWAPGSKDPELKKLSTKGKAELNKLIKKAYDKNVEIAAKRASYLTKVLGNKARVDGYKAAKLTSITGGEVPNGSSECKSDCWNNFPKALEASHLELLAKDRRANFMIELQGSNPKEMLENAITVQNALLNVYGKNSKAFNFVYKNVKK